MTDEIIYMDYLETKINWSFHTLSMKQDQESWSKTQISRMQRLLY